MSQNHSICNHLKKCSWKHMIFCEFHKTNEAYKPVSDCIFITIFLIILERIWLLSKRQNIYFQTYLFLNNALNTSKYLSSAFWFEPFALRQIDYTMTRKCTWHWVYELHTQNDMEVGLNVDKTEHVVHSWSY